MTLTSKINGKTKRDKEFREILLSVEPNKKDYYTLSKRTPFSHEYNAFVPNTLSNHYDSSLIGIAFDYLARFRVANFLKREDVVEGMASLDGFNKLRKRPEFIKRNLELNQPYLSWIHKILEFINDDASMSISNLYGITTHLAKLEQIKRRRIAKDEILDVDYLLFEPVPEEIINDLNNLMTVFEGKFMIPEVINQKSKVFFNPNFGASSILVGGADADIFIDGTLYDFKTTKDQALAKRDNLQLIGYFLLNALSKEFLITPNFEMDIKRIAFYKARFGEVEYFNIAEYLSVFKNGLLERKLKEMAEYFKDNQGNLQMAYPFDYDGIQDILKGIRDWDIEDIVTRIKNKQKPYIR